LFVKRVWKKNSRMSFVSSLNFRCSRTFISIVNFVIRSWFFLCFLCLIRLSRLLSLLFYQTLQMKSDRRLCSLFDSRKKNRKLKKRLFSFSALLFASSSVRLSKIYSFLFFRFLNQSNDRLLSWIRKKAKSFREKK
jgi:hypothetical protein